MRMRTSRYRYGIDWYTEGRWFSIGRTWWTRRGVLRACRRVLRDARCGAARVVIVLTLSTAPARPAPWHGAGARAAVGTGR